MASVMIGVDPHKGSHTAVAIGTAEEVLGQLRVRASAAQAGRLLAWAKSWPERTWAVEGAGGLGHLLSQQLVAAGEHVLDVRPSWPRGSGCWSAQNGTICARSYPADRHCPHANNRQGGWVVSDMAVVPWFWGGLGVVSDVPVLAVTSDVGLVCPGLCQRLGLQIRRVRAIAEVGKGTAMTSPTSSGLPTTCP